MKRAPGGGNCTCKGPVVAMSKELKEGPHAQSTGGWVVVRLGLCFGEMRAERQAGPRAPRSPGTGG